MGLRKFLLNGFVILLFAGVSDAREWVSIDGKSSFRAELYDYSPPTVTVIKPNGEYLSFNHSYLSAEDVRYCESQAEILREKRKKENARRVIEEKIVKGSVDAYPYKVIQVLENGILCRDNFPPPRPEGIDYTYGDMPSRFPKEAELYRLREAALRREWALKEPYVFFILGDFRGNVADGDSYKSDLFWTGSTFTYQTVGGGEVGVSTFALSMDKAVEKWGKPVASPEYAVREPVPDKPAPGVARSSGTGFAISSEGYIVTNAHVIKGASRIIVHISGKAYDARTRAIDEANDLAIIKVEHRTPPLPLRTEGEAKLGESIKILGYPIPDIQGKSIKLTTGIVSSLRGMRDDIRHYQIDAAIQPGNSGGPLIDAKGQVLGVVKSSLDDGFIASRTGAIPQNVNYAIKIDLLVALIKSVDGLWGEVSEVPVPAKPEISNSAASTFLIEVEL